MKQGILSAILFAYLFFFTSLSITVYAQTGILQQNIQKIIQSKNAHIGVSICGPSAKDILIVNGADHYPMQSVFKFHLALAVLHRVDKGELSPDQKIFIKKSDLLPGMWSPLREDHPEGNLYLPLRELLRYTVSMSDNNGCDILFRLMGGTGKVTEYIHSLGIQGRRYRGHGGRYAQKLAGTIQEPDYSCRSHAAAFKI